MAIFSTFVFFLVSHIHKVLLAQVSQPSTWRSLQSIPRSPTCFTQGLEFVNASIAVESCGLYGKSLIRLLDFDDIDPQLGPKIIRFRQLPPNLFAEGLTVVGGNIYLLTWREGYLQVFDSQTLDLKKSLEYPFEGWGLAYRPSTQTFLATDGSSNIHHLEISDTGVNLLKSIPVSCNDKPLMNLNELEVAKSGDILANVWYSRNVYQIDPDSGSCKSFIDLSSLQKGNQGDSLNGLAIPISDAAQKGRTRLWLTGKLWSYLHLIEVDM